MNEYEIHMNPKNPVSLSECYLKYQQARSVEDKRRALRLWKWTLKHYFGITRSKQIEEAEKELES